jgi:hypothetical protein
MPITPQDTESVRNYVKNLPDKERGEFISRYNALDTEKKATLVSRLATQATTPKEEDMGTGDYAAVAGGLGLAGGAIGAGAVGVGKLKDYWNAPKQQLAPIEEQFNLWRKQNPSMAGTMSEDMPRLIERDIQGIKSNQVSKKQNIQQKFAEGQKVLKQKVVDLDRGILNSSVENVVDLVSKESPKIIQDTYKAYEVAIDVADEWMISKGQTISGADFKGMLEDVAQSAYRKGVPEGSLQKLLDEIPNEHLTIKQAKGLVKNIAKDLPLDAKYSLTDGWGKFLQDKTPAESSAMISKVNKDYKPFVDLRKQISGARGDRRKIFQLIHGYAKGKERISQVEVENLMKTLGEGTDLTPSIKGIKEGFKSVQNVRGKRIDIGNAVKQSEISQKVRLQKVNLIKQKLDELVAWRNKAETLLSQKDAIIAKAPIRTQGALKTILGIGRTARDISRIARPFSVSLGFLNAIDQANIAQDVARGKEGAYGVNMLGSAIRVPMDTEEQKIKYGLIG